MSRDFSKIISINPRNLHPPYNHHNLRSPSLSKQIQYFFLKRISNKNPGTLAEKFWRLVGIHILQNLTFSFVKNYFLKKHQMSLGNFLKFEVNSSFFFFPLKNEFIFFIKYLFYTQTKRGTGTPKLRWVLCNGSNYRVLLVGV